jgi:DNA replication protein DnaC
MSGQGVRVQWCAEPQAPPGTGKTHLAIGLGIRACQGGHRVPFATASEWVDRLSTAHHGGRPQNELAGWPATR